MRLIHSELFFLVEVGTADSTSIDSVPQRLVALSGLLLHLGFSQIENKCHHSSRWEAI